MRNLFSLPRLALLLALLLPGAFQRAAAQQNVGIGTTAPTQTLDVNGAVRVRGLTGSGTRLPVVLPDGTLGVSAPVYGTPPAFPTTATGTALTGGNAQGVALSGTTAYVITQGTGTNFLKVYNVASPLSPTLLGQVGTDVNPSSVAVSGTTV